MSIGKVILVRGIPGSGKSFHVEQLRTQWVSKWVKPGSADDFVVCSADDFYKVRVPIFRDGVNTQETRLEYRFDPMKLPQAHNASLSKFVDAIHFQVRMIVVDNTFVRLWEMANYIGLANHLDYEVEVHEIVVETIEQLRVCVSRNVHGVPADIIARMAMEFETMKPSATGLHWDKVVRVPFGGMQ